MRLLMLSSVMLSFTVTAALSGGGTVTSTEPGPQSLTQQTTAQILETIGISAPEKAVIKVAAAVTYTTPPRKVTYTPPAVAAVARAKSEAEEIKTVEVAAPKGPLDPRETIRQCTTCHGVDGIARIPTAPNIAGSSRGYLETQLKAFRSGKRENEVMRVIAEDLSNAEIKAVAKWYSSLKVTVEVPE